MGLSEDAAEDSKFFGLHVFDGALSVEYSIPTEGTTSYAWRTFGVEKIMDNVAKALTRLTVNQALNPNGTTTVGGKLGITTNVVNVRWEWLILPYALCIAGVIFLAITVISTRRHRSPLWKSSVNALLYHGVYRDAVGDGELATLSEMDAQAAKTRANLTLSGLKQRLVLETHLVRADGVGDVT
jgi:hypothetical protein